MTHSNSVTRGGMNASDLMELCSIEKYFCFQRRTTQTSPLKRYTMTLHMGLSFHGTTSTVENAEVVATSTVQTVVNALLSPSSSVSEAGLKEIQPVNTFQVPTFAQSVYPLLLDLHNIFIDLPSIGRALAFAQKMLDDVNRGEAVDTQIISEVHTFRVAVEGLRIALNSAGRLPVKEVGKPNKTKVEFSELQVQDKSYALIAQALQSQTRKFKTIVAVVDASGLAGLETLEHSCSSRSEGLGWEACH
uniref:Uncharacterized protein n=1 Tax=Salix viminalis TaxID=40686 RepID=A0A6N2MF00_SALVM